MGSFTLQIQLTLLREPLLHVHNIQFKITEHHICANFEIQRNYTESHDISDVYYINTHTISLDFNSDFFFVNKENSINLIEI